jgi:heavy metal translocating P-type ATPase
MVSTTLFSPTHNPLKCPILIAETESCLVELARRECNNEYGHDPVDIKKLSQSSRGSAANDDIALNTKSDNQPCARHYQKTKDRYGAMLDNLGCICKVLLSLNIESCCVIPSHAPKRVTASENAEASKEATRNLSTPTLYRSMTSMETEKTDNCSKKSCCNDDSPKVVPMAVPEVTSLKNEEYSKKNRCKGDPPEAISEAVREVASSKDDDCHQKSCCSSKISKPATESTVAKADECCSNAKLEEKATKASVVNVDDYFGKSYYTKSASKPVSTVNASKVEDCLKEACCTGEVSVSSCSSAANTDVQSALAVLDSIKIAATAPTTLPITGIDNVDIENGLSEVEHLVLSVHGMTCTGCEKKLYRSLDSLPAVSNIKTSLVLAQAEFDLSGSTSVDSVNIVKTIEKMTGFTCTKMIQSGEELNMMVGGNVQDFAREEDWPLGVTDLTVIGKNTIRVTYHPKIIGARELLSNPFFRLAKLAPPTARPLIASGRAHVRMSFFMTLLSALLTIPVLILAWAPLPEHKILYGAISLGLGTIVQTVVAGPFYSGALKALIFSRMIEMDLLIVLSTSTAYVYSVIAYAYLVVGKPLSTGEFFETSTLLVTLIMVGRAISAFARQRAVESISIESLQTPSALLIDPKTRQEDEIDARLLQYQDTFKVLPDTSIVTDGIVIVGETEVDESMVTGEATLVTKKPGMSVVAGSINHSGTLIVRLTRLPGENTIKTIGIMVDEAKSSKPRIQEIADRIASFFVPTILIITLVVFLIWVVIGKAVRHQSAATTCIVSMTYAISALIVSCPCAIGLAVPMVVAIAGGVAAKHGLIFRSAETIETARNITHVIFDKTGTLTHGKLSVVAEEYPAGKADWLAPMILGLTTHSKHPVSTAIAAHMKALEVQPSQVENVVSVAGNGIEATWNGKIIRAGNSHWLGCQDSPIVHEILSNGLTMFCVSMEGELVAVFGLKDLLRPDAIETINQLKKRSVQVSIVSGDNEDAVQSVARQLDIPQSHVRFRCSPHDKQIYVKEMLTPKSSVVMFCGDGTNDAVALAQASIGIHINEGTDIAQSAADAILMRPSLSGILVLIDLSRAFYRRVFFNFTWAFVYNVFAILLAAGAFPRARIPPQYAGLGEIVSVLPVIAIAMGLKWARFQGRE